MYSWGKWRFVHVIVSIGANEIYDGQGPGRERRNMLETLNPFVLQFRKGAADGISKCRGFHLETQPQIKPI